MFLVRNRQMDVMDLEIKKKFIIETAKDMNKYYPEWCVGKSEEAIKEFVEKIVQFAHNYRIFMSHNIYDLIHIEINYDLFSLLNRNLSLKQILSNANRIETLRIEDVKTYLLKSLNN